MSEQSGWSDEVETLKTNFTALDEAHSQAKTPGSKAVFDRRRREAYHNLVAAALRTPRADEIRAALDDGEKPDSQ
jgi:hypothetical protein